MYGYVGGYSDENIIHYCPYCGSVINRKYGNGMAECDECGMKFYVIEDDDSEREE